VVKMPGSLTGTGLGKESEAGLIHFSCYAGVIWLAHLAG